MQRSDLPGFVLGVGVSGVLHVAYMLVLQQGYRIGNLSTVYATARGSGPFLSVIAAILLLGERPSVWALAGVLAIIAGVVALGFVDRPSAGAGRRGVDPSIGFGLLTGLSIAVYTIWDTHAVREWQLAPIPYMVGTCAVEIVVFSVMLRRRWRETAAFARFQWRRVTIAPVALVAPLREVSVVLVSLFGVIALKESRPVARLLASGMVVAGIVLLAS
jgi:drug/metabolite transporter (DMT)-like permease